MKKLVFFFIVFVVFCLDGFAQPKSDKTSANSKKEKDTSIDRKIRTYVVEYDFKTGLFPYGRKIKPRVDVPLVFRIKNINRLAYTIDIQSKDSVIGFSDLSGLELLLEEKEAKKIEENLKKSGSISIVPANTPPVNTEDFFKRNKDELTKLVNDINQTNVNLLDKLNTKLNELSKPENKETDIIQLRNVEIPESLNTIFPYHFNAQNELAALYFEIVEKRQALISLGNDYLGIKTFINNPLLDSAGISLKEEELTTVYNSFNENKNSLSDFSLLVSKFQNKYKALKANPEITQKADYGGSIKLFSIADNLNNEVTAIKKQIEGIKFDIIKQNIDQIYQLLFINEDKESLFEYVSDPIQPFQDVAIFEVKIEKNDKNASPFYNKRDFSYKEFTRHGIRFDLNIGVAGSLYDKDNFYDIKVDAENVNRITNADRSGFSPSFVGFFTVSYRSATHISFGLSTGLGISADDGTITLDNFFIGPSLIVGRHERVNLTAGVSIKNLPQLNSGYEIGEEVPIAYTIETVTTKSYQAGLFVAITYNLTNGVKNNVKQIKNFL